MSLRETIEGARREAAEAGTLVSGKSKETEPEAAEAARQQGFSRRSAARSKPRRELAGSVSSVAGTAGVDKEKAKQAKSEKRERDDLRFDARTALLESDESYRRMYKLWFVMIIIGFVLTVISFILSRIASAQDAFNTRYAMVSVGLMVAAYAIIIWAFIYDWRKIRPLRKRAEETAKGMTQKRLRKVVSEYQEMKAAEKAAKKARK